MKQAILDVMAKLEMAADRERLNGIEGGIDALQYDSAKLLYIMALGAKAKSIVEVGTGVGYATLWLGAAAEIMGGKVVSCEIDGEKLAEAKANIEAAGLADHVEFITGDARDTLREQSGKVDMLFIDASLDIGNYETYFDVVYKRLEAGSLVVADNVKSHEFELDDYITYVQTHPNLDSQTVPIGDGLEVSVKIS
jgi:predicted O-methyltransferase YrrM